jgi:phage-related protein
MIAAAVHEAIGPALETMQKDIKAMKSDLASVSQSVDNFTEEVLKLETGLNFLNNSVTHDFSGFERGLSGLNSTANKICDNISLHLWRYRRLETCSLS